MTFKFSTSPTDIIRRSDLIFFSAIPPNFLTEKFLLLSTIPIVFTTSPYLRKLTISYKIFISSMLWWTGWVRTGRTPGRWWRRSARSPWRSRLRAAPSSPGTTSKPARSAPRVSWRNRFHSKCSYICNLHYFSWSYRLAVLLAGSDVTRLTISRYLARLLYNPTYPTNIKNVKVFLQDC